MTIFKNYANKVLLFVFLISLFNYIDRQVLFAVFPLIKEELALSDVRLGMLGSAFMIVYMCVAPFTGYIGDRIKRPGIIGVSAIVWSIATLAGGLSGNYGQLLAARSIVGIGEAGYGTVSPSYLAEWFPKDRRARILAIYALAIPVGSAIGYILGGWLGGHFGWREAFYIVAVPGILLGIYFLFFRETPEREAEDKRASLPEYLSLLKNRTFLLICLAESVATFSVGGLAAWMPSFFERTFGLSVAKAGLYFGALTVLGGITGTLAGGWFADRLRKHTCRAYFITGFFSLVLAAPFGIAAVFASSLVWSLAMIFLAEFFVFAYSGPYHAAIVEAVPLEVRSMAFAVEIFIIHALGDAISPVVLGKISDMTSSLGIAIVVSMVYLLAGGAVSLLAGRTWEKQLNSKAGCGSQKQDIQAGA
ncbi:MAG: MFS transporter [Elusimicrobiales bacterium]|nr:MFS transporter [Elusimicrobiales bacterium]